MRQSVVNKATKVIELMKKGLSLSVSCKMAKIDQRTLMKALKKMHVGKRKKGGKYFITFEYNKKLIDGMIYLMSGGFSASKSARKLHTTLKRLTRMNVDIKGTPVPVISKDGERYVLNVRKISKYSVVFYGRIISGKNSVILGEDRRGTDFVKDDNDVDDRYADILWQIDFDSFTSTLMPYDICKYYPNLLRDFFSKAIEGDVPVVSPLVSGLVSKKSFERPHEFARMLFPDEKDKDRYLAKVSKVQSGIDMGVMASPLEIILGQVGVRFDGIMKCGLDKRNTTEDYVTATDFNANSDVKDIGKFVVTIRRKNASISYPNPPYPVELHRDLKAESKIPRRVYRK